MERDVILAKLIEVQQNIEPGNKKIFDLEAVILGLKYPEDAAFGHGQVALLRVKKDYERLGIILLQEFGISTEDNSEINDVPHLSEE